MCNTCTHTCQCKPFTITKPGEYRTVLGKKAVVLGFNTHNYAIGYIENDTLSTRWFTNGNACENIANKSIVSEWKEPVVIDWWQNVYVRPTLNGTPQKFLSKAFALSCVKLYEGNPYLGTIHIRYTEGKGAEIIKD